MRIRRATSEDAPTLTSLVRNSSAYSGEYKSIVESLAISSEQILEDSVHVCESEGRVVGFYSLIVGAEVAELDYMFVADEAQGKGVGRRLFEHMQRTARQAGCVGVLIISHPPTEPFYAKMGVVGIGAEPPKGRIFWERPRMWLDVRR